MPGHAPDRSLRRAAVRARPRRLALPALRELLALLPQQDRDDGEEWSFSPPHERAMARSLGFAGGDGCLPWAAGHAAADGLAGGDLAWGELTPAHWHLGTDQVSLLDPGALLLAAAEAPRALQLPGLTNWGASSACR